MFKNSNSHSHHLQHIIKLELPRICIHTSVKLNPRVFLNYMMLLFKADRAACRMKNEVKSCVIQGNDIKPA